MTEKIAVIGMGQMGSAMAGRLRESNLDVVGFDISADQRARLVKEGFRMISISRLLMLMILRSSKSFTRRKR